MATPNVLGTTACFKEKFLSVLAVASDLVTVVPALVALLTAYNFFDLGAMLMVINTMFGWCGTVLRVFLEFKY